ncbi:unnamed protein product [Rotaria socialis]|uniref:Uncharacterized protein n=1 Tax=Rotaria socialis TaxID=392032 RepID=A0A820XID6_9BILA|nr:unnamed protein product [Rotaria socialis]
MQRFLAEDNKNNFHKKSKKLKNHVEKSIDQTLDYSSNYFEETSMNPLNDQSSTYNILDQSMNDGDPLSNSDNETHSHLLPNDNQISNTDHQSKAQRQLDEEDIPPADMKLNEIPIQNDNLIIIKTMMMIDNIISDEPMVDETESKTNLIENRSSHESDIEDEEEDEQNMNVLTGESTESDSNLTEDSHSVESEKSNENNNQNDVSLIESTKQNEDVDEHDISSDKLIIDQTGNILTELQSNINDNHSLVNLERTNESDNSLVDSTADQTKNSSRESEKENENPSKSTEINTSLKSCLLTDVANEIVEENQLNNQLIDTDDRLEIKSNNFNNEYNEKQSSEFEDILGNKSLLKQTIVTGESDSRPTRSTMATVLHKLSVIDSLTSNIHLIENVLKETFFISECDTIGAIDICVQTMNRGECALINCDIRHGYGDMGCHEKQIPAISTNKSYRMLIE